jgi:hypothetical protein
LQFSVTGCTYVAYTYVSKWNVISIFTHVRCASGTGDGKKSLVRQTLYWSAPEPVGRRCAECILMLDIGAARALRCSNGVMLNLFPSWESRSRQHEQSRRTHIRALILLSSLVLIVAIAVLAELAHGHRGLDGVERPASPPLDKAAPSREPALPARTVFRHSVVPGGVLTADEVERAMVHDGIVAAHYSAINPRELHVETLPEDRAAYMSYRIGDEVFWTKQKVRLPRGETILTDGAHQIRTRCGNCIAFAPMSPTSDDEPDAMEFDALIGEPDVIGSHRPMGSELLFGPVGIALPWLLSDATQVLDGDETSGGGTIGTPVFGYAADPGLSVGDLVLFPLIDDESGSHEFPALDGPFRYPPGDEHNPEVPTIPVDPHNPVFPPVENPVVPAPEPATLLLVGSGLTAFLARRRRR